ncbi:hypothetical protein MICRO8M_70335 [Microbacterium sp. 8M]|nr:hypothetical protein MICRO8M_70335 [Microbacterium sp. 8M]
MFFPGGGFRGVVSGLQHGDVLHEAAGGRGMPVVLAGRRVERLPRVNLDDVAVAVAESGDPGGDAEVLPARMAVPGGAGAGGEADERNGHPLVAVVRGGDGVDPDVASKLLRRVLHRGYGRFDVHAFSVSNSTLMARRSSMAR